MYKVLIVDDEKPAREILSSIIRWDEVGFVVTGSAKNGKEALAKFMEEKYDLIITDIQMPGMDGLELIKRIREDNRQQKFVILSCHENFNYAREAIKLGVNDYLLKHFLTPEDLYGVLQKVKYELDECSTEETTAENDFKKNRIEAEDAKYRTIALKTIVFENPEEEKVRKTVENYRLNLDGDSFALFCMIIDDYKKFIQNKSESDVKKEIDNVLDTIQDSFCPSYTGECFYNGSGEFIAIVNVENSKSDLIYISSCYTVTQKAMVQVSKKHGVSMTIGISSGFCKLSLAGKKYLEASNTAKYRMFYGKGAILFFHMHIVKHEIFKPELVEGRIAKIRELLGKEDMDHLRLEMRRLYHEEVKGFMQYNYLKYINSCMFNIIIEYMNRASVAYINVFAVDYLPVDEVQSLETVEEICEWFCNIFISVHQLKRQYNQPNINIAYSKRVNDIIDYVGRNYSRDIGLSQVADELKMNKSYLCRLFKQETGENFSNYLLRVRIEIAKKLIREHEFKLYEVAHMTGFTNAQQFSTLFKRVTGQNPIDYRSKLS